MDTVKPENVSLLEQRMADRIEPWKPSLLQRITAGVMAAALYILPMAGCGDGNNPDPTAINPIPSDYNVAANITPASGTGVGPDDDPLAVRLRTPALSPACAADPDCTALATGDGVDVTVNATYDNATPGNASDDETVTVATQNNVAWDTVVAGSITMANAHGGAGLADGERITIDAVVTATDTEGSAQTARGNATLTYEAGSVNPVRVTGCYVNSANIGRTLGISCYAMDSNDPSGMSLVGNWHLTSDISRATISDSALGSAEILASTLGASDVDLHNYSVTASNGTDTSDSLDFEVPVDKHASYLRLHCSDGTNHRLLLQESTVNTASEACFTGYNQTLKPNRSGEPAYIGDVDPSCARTALESLPAAEREAHRFYNGSSDGDKTPASVFSSCTVDIAQVEYGSDAE